MPHWLRGQHGWRLAGLWAVVFFAYSNSFTSGFIFDNRPIILEDPRVHVGVARGFAPIVQHGYWPNGKHAGLYRPLTTFSYLFNYTVLGNASDPTGYHAFNLFFHIVNVSLAYALGLAIFGSPGSAWVLAGAWGLHPLLTESVTNIVGRADLLAGFGVLAGLLCYIHGRSAAGRSRFLWMAGLGIAQLFGLLSKESAAILIGLMIFYDILWRSSAKKGTGWPFYFVAASCVIAFAVLRAQSHPELRVFFNDNSMAGAGFLAARMTAIKVAAKYAWLFVWPATLSADYSFNAVPLFTGRLSEWEDLKAVLALAVFVVAGFLAIRFRNTQRSALFFLTFSLLTVLPASNLVILIGTVMAERFMYLPALGLAGCLIAIGTQLPRRIFWAAAGVVCVLLGSRTYARNWDWQNDLSLWTSAVAACPESAKAHMNLGQAYSEVKGRMQDAISEYQTALRIEPSYAQAHYNLGTALAGASGQLDHAIAEYRSALASDPDYAEAHNNLGEALARMPGRLAEATDEFRAAIRLRPDYVQAHNNLANALSLTSEKRSEAMAEYDTALGLDTNLAEAHFNRANLLARTPGRIEEGIAEYRQSIAMRPNFAEAHNNLGIALMQIPNRVPEAICEFEAAMAAKPEYADAHLNLGLALLQTPDRMTDAIRELQTAVHIDPRLERAHYNLGVALSKIPGRLPDAIRELEIAVHVRPDRDLQKAIDQLRERK